MDSFIETWDTKREETKEIIIDFFKDLTDFKQIEAIDISLKTMLKKRKGLTEFLEPISAAVEIVETKNLNKYYDLQVEERNIVVDIVRKLTESEELLLEEYKSRGNARP